MEGLIKSPVNIKRSKISPYCVCACVPARLCLQCVCLCTCTYSRTSEFTWIQCYFEVIILLENNGKQILYETAGPGRIYRVRVTKHNMVCFIAACFVPGYKSKWPLSPLNRWWLCKIRMMSITMISVLTFYILWWKSGGCCQKPWI